jgi:hypothetical protein
MRRILRADSDLAPVRGEALGELSEPEQKKWHALWAQIEALASGAR